MRPSAPLSIRRSTLRSHVDQLGRRVVLFQYDSKSSAARHVATDSNYVSHICDRTAEDICPACLVLRLDRRVRATPFADDHDLLFTTELGRPLQAIA